MKMKLYAFMSCLKRNYVKITKTIWLILLLCICGLYIMTNYNRMITRMMYLDYIVVLLSIVLVLMPLVSEMDLWGFKVKREIQRVEKELNREIIYLQKQMMNVETYNSQNINLGYLPTKEELMASIKNDSTISLDSDSEDKKMLFYLNTRIALDREVDRAVSSLGWWGDNNLALRRMNSDQVINEEEYEKISKIKNICNRAIHGEIISNQYYYYVKENFPVVLKKLKAI